MNYYRDPDITHIGREAFAIVGKCREGKKTFGITVDPQGGSLKLVWTFKLDDAKAHREKFDQKSVHGAVVLDDKFPGCPYCKSKDFWYCGNCGTANCWHGEETVTCGKCGITSGLNYVDSLDLKGGGY